MLLIGGAFVGVTGRDGDLDPALLHLVEEAREPVGRGPVEHGAIDLDSKALRLGQLDRLDRNFISAVLIDGVVVHALVAIKMD